MTTNETQEFEDLMREEAPLATPTQADRVIATFGGARKLAALLDRTPSAIYKWTYPRERGGTAGYIPSSVWPSLYDLARRMGISLKVDPQ